MADINAYAANGTDDQLPIISPIGLEANHNTIPLVSSVGTAKEDTCSIVSPIGQATEVNITLISPVGDQADDTPVPIWSTVGRGPRGEDGRSVIDAEVTGPFFYKIVGASIVEQHIMG